jgi:tetratricopeptide (TPR) repeat protein
MKPSLIQGLFTRFTAVCLLAGGLLCVRGAVFAAEAAPPPPPFINPDAPAGPAVPFTGEGAFVTGPTPTPGLPEFKPSDTMDSAVAAPQISDDQQIKNSLEMVYQLFHAEDYESAGKGAAQILDRYPKKPLYWVRYLYALCLELQNLYFEAIPQYQKVKEQSSRSTYANASSFRIGLCELKSGQKEEAIYTLRDIIENNPRSEYRLQAYVHLGNLYRRTRDWRAAQRIYKDLIRLYPNTQWAYNSTMYLAETHAHQGHNSTAIKVYQGMLRNPEIPLVLRAQAQLRIGDLYIVDQQWLEALNVYRVALRDYSDVPGISTVAEQKIAVATEGRRSGRLPYRSLSGPRARTEGPADQNYQLKQEKEAVPYQD